MSIILRLCILLFGLVLTPFPGLSQITITPLDGPQTLVACGEAGSFEVYIVAESAESFPGGTLSIQFPQGLTYQPGSMTGAAETDLSDPNELVFTLPANANLPSAIFSFQAAIDCRFLNDEPIRYLFVSADGDVTTATDPSLANYFFPEVVAVDIQNQTLPLALGQSGTRSYTVIQATPGARIDSLFLVATYDPGLQSATYDHGQFYGSGPTGDTLLITGNEFPGGNGFFEYGDTLVIQEINRLLQCQNSNLRLELFWRCNGVLCQSFVNNGITVLANGSPDLRITNQNGFGEQAVANDATLVGGGFCEILPLWYLIENTGWENTTGAGGAYDVTVAFGLNGNLYSAPTPDNFTNYPNWRLNAWSGTNALPLSDYQFPGADPLRGYNIRFSTLTTDPDGPGGLTDLDGDGFYDDLPAGESTLIRINVNYDPDATGDCVFLSGKQQTGGAQTSFRIGYHYLDQCATPDQYWYGVNDPGINVIELFSHRTGPPILELDTVNLIPGESPYLRYIPGGDWASPCEPTDSFVLEVILPRGITLGEGASIGPGTHFGLIEVSGDTVRFASSRRGGISEPWSFPITVDCDSPTFDPFFQFSFLYYCDPDCPQYKRIDCARISLDYLPQCETCEDGVVTQEFALQRVSLGWSDLFRQQRVDPATNPAINLEAGLNYDSVRVSLTGEYQGTGPFDSLFARLSYQPIDLIGIQPTEPHFLPLSGEMIYTTATGDSFVCPVTQWESTYSAIANRHLIDVDLEQLFAPGGCLSGVQRQAGDHVSLSFILLVSGNTPVKALPVPQLIGGFFSRIDGQDESCRELLAKFVLENVDPKIHVSYGVQQHFGCDEVFFTGTFLNNIGHLLDGDQFPDEIRSIAALSEFRVYIEGRWLYKLGSSQIRAVGSLDIQNEPSDVAPGGILPIGDPEVSFDGINTVLRFVNPGDWPAGDLALNGSDPQANLWFRAYPTCAVNDGVSFRIRAEADITKFIHAPVDRQITLTAASESDAKSYRRQRALFTLTSPQTANPIEDSVRWSFRLENVTSYAGSDKTIYNNWIAVRADTDIEILKLVDVSNPGAPIDYPAAAYGTTGDRVWFRVGDLTTLSNRQFTLVGRANTCEPASLTLYHGFNCIDYPDPDPEAGYPFATDPYTCAADSLNLRIQPGQVSLSLDLSNPPLPASLCGVLPYTLNITNLQLPYVYNIRAAIELPAGIRVLDNSSRLEYPAGSGQFIPLPDPVLTESGTWEWPLAEYLPVLKGIDRAPENRARLHFDTRTDCNFLARRRILLNASGESNCGETIQRRLYSLPISIQGIAPVVNEYDLRLTFPEGGIQSCGASSVRFSVTNLGPFPTSAIEYAGLNLPEGLDYVPGSLIGLHNPISATPENRISNGLRLLGFPIPAGVAPGDSIVFSFQLRDVHATGRLGCAFLDLEALYLILTEMDCPTAATGVCNLFSIVESRPVTAAVLSRPLLLSAGQWTSIPVGTAGEWITGVLRVGNANDFPVAIDSVQVSVYHDTNGDGMVDPAADSNLGSFGTAIGSLATGQTLLDTIQFFAPTDQIEQLLLLMTEKGRSCSCDTVLLRAPVPQLRNASADRSVCSGSTIELGIDQRNAGLDFFWEPLFGAPSAALSTTDQGIISATFDNPGSDPLRYTYRLTTTRASGFSSADTVQLTILPLLRIDISPAVSYLGRDVSCFDSADGALGVTTAFGTPPFSYQLGSVTQSDSVFADLAAGSYEIWVTDANGCRRSATGQLVPPPPLTVTLNADSTSCHGGADGAVTALPAGGTAPYTFDWEPPQAADQPMATGLSPGWYPLVLTDANGCRVVDSARVADPPSLTASFTQVGTTCFDSNDGYAEVTQIEHGQGPFGYLWPDGTTADRNGTLAPGSHTVTITDSRGCSESFTLQIPAPPPIDIAANSVTPTRCYGSADGAVTLQMTGGTPPYSYLWNTDDTTATIAAVPAGTYQATVTDANGCIYSTPTFTVEQPDSLLPQLADLQTPSCPASADGSVRLFATGGTPPYSYAWPDGNTVRERNDLSATDYLVTVTDFNGCTAELAFRLAAPTPMEATLLPRAPGCNQEYGTILVSMQWGTGTPPYRYSVDGGTTFQRDSLLTELLPGRHRVLIRDQRGCRIERSDTIPEPQNILLDLPTEMEVVYGDSVAVPVIITNATGPVRASWQPANRDLSCIDCLEPTILPQTSTGYLLSVIDSIGCTAQALLRVVVTKPRRVYIPTAFSPNRDGYNDRFTIYAGPEVVIIESVRIYNRWGEMVFQAEDVKPNDERTGWDGRWRNDALNAGTFTYLVTLRFTDGLRETKRGTLQLIK